MVRVFSSSCPPGDLVAFYTDRLNAAGWSGTFNSPGASPFISVTQTNSTTQSGGTSSATGRTAESSGGAPPRVGNFIGVDATGATVLFVALSSAAPTGISSGAAGQTYVEVVEERAPNSTTTATGGA